MAWHSVVNDIPCHHGHAENHVDNRSALVYRENEFRTPSPLLPSWYQSQPFGAAAMDEDSNDDCYFHSSENIDSSYLHRPDVNFVNCELENGLSSRSQITALDASNDCHTQCTNTDLAADSFGSRFMRTEKTLDERTYTRAKSLNVQRTVIVRRSKPGLFDICGDC